MGLFDRDYCSGNGYSGHCDWMPLTPVVKWLIIANVVMFLLQLLVVRDPRPRTMEELRRQNPALDKALSQSESDDPAALDALEKGQPDADALLREDREALLPPGAKVSVLQMWLELDTRKVIHGGQVWRLVTCAFCHDRYGLLHILINMLFLYGFGRTIESMYGSREFLLFYLAATVVASLAFIGLDLYTGSFIPAVGASGAVLAVVMLYTMHFPYEEICVCWFFPLQMRWLMLFYVLFDLHPVLLALAGDRLYSGIAHAAHLGGIAFGFLYARYEWQFEPLLDCFKFSGCRTKRRGRSCCAFDVSEPEPDPEMVVVDEILEKIQRSGQASLTEDERATLLQASERFRTRAGKSDRSGRTGMRK